MVRDKCVISAPSVSNVQLSMTLAYTTWFAGVWGVSILAIPSIPVLFVVAALSTDPAVTAVTGTTATLLLAFALYTRYWPRIKHQIRAGVFPLSLCDYMPTTEAEFTTACLNAYRKGTLTVVSHGWSFYLAKRRATGNRVWTLRYTGQTETGAWKSGTTIKQLKKALAKKGRTVAVNPTMEFASLGSWIATCSHGHPGSDTVDTDWIETARVLHVETGEISEDGPVELMAKFGTKDLEGKHVVIDVKVATVKNVYVERFARRIDTIEATTWWMAGTHVRLMFIGTAGPLGIVWNSTNTIEGKHMHPHRCSVFCFWFTADCLQALPGAWLGDLNRFQGYATLANANASINPPFYPIFSIWGQLCCVYNLELFVPWTPNATQLASVVADIHAFHRKYYGRTELRMDSTTVYIDISLRSIAKFKLYFGMLFMKHGIKSAAQHSGKYRMTSISPLKEISPVAAVRPVTKV